MNELPSFAHRSISVREQRKQTLPQLQRSASTYASENTSSPVEIGTKGSVFSLVSRDITACSSDSVIDSTSKKALNYVWYNRLWLMPRMVNASHKHKATRLQTVDESKQETKIPKWNASHKHKATRLQTVDASKQEAKIPKWKRLLKKLKGGSALSRGDGSAKSNEMTRGISHIYDTRRDTPFPPLQTSNAPTTPIWERRSFVQITPLDFSHLYTARIKKELARRN